MKTVKKQDRESRKLAAILREHYQPRYPRAELEVYRYNSASIRLRVIEPDFGGKDLIERDDEIWVVLRKFASKDIIS